MYERVREIYAREERKRKRDVYTRRITKYTWRKYIKVWMRGTHSEIEHVCTDDCEFPRERRFVLWALLLLAGKGKTKELVILSVLGFSSRGYFLRFTRIMRPFDLNRNASRVSSPFSVSILRACERERKEGREREREREKGRGNRRVQNTFHWWTHIQRATALAPTCLKIFQGFRS